MAWNLRWCRLAHQMLRPMIYHGLRDRCSNIGRELSKGIEVFMLEMGSYAELTID